MFYGFLPLYQTPKECINISGSDQCLRFFMAAYSKKLLLVLIFCGGIVLGFLAGGVLPQKEPPRVLQVIVAPGAPAPVGPYSQAVQYGDLVFTSGQIGISPTNGTLPDSTGNQTVQVMENLKTILGEAGLGFEDVIQARIYLTDMDDFTTVNAIYGRYFSGSYPSRSTVEVSALPKGATVEIEMIAKKAPGKYPASP